jgi:hypothetical protein
MRMHLLFPLAFLSGVYGFAIFVPYLIAIMIVWHLSQGRKKVAIAPILAGFAHSAEAVPAAVMATI